MDLEWKDRNGSIEPRGQRVEGFETDPAWDVSGVRDMAGGVIASRSYCAWA